MLIKANTQTTKAHYVTTFHILQSKVPISLQPTDINCATVRDIVRFIRKLQRFL